jgi:putative ABC transport system permease protein
MNEPLNNRMFWRLWLRALTVKRPQAVLAISSLLVGGATVSMLLNLYSDVHRQMTQEFSAYGANVVLAPKETGEPLRGAAGRGPGVSIESKLMNEDVLDRLQRLERGTRAITVVPRLDVITQVERAQPDSGMRGPVSVVAVGADFRGLQRLNPGWRLEGGTPLWDGNACAIGTNLAARLDVRIGDTIRVGPVAANQTDHSLSQQAHVPQTGRRDDHNNVRSTGDRPQQITLAERAGRDVFSIGTIVSTGSTEDDQVFVPLARLQDLTGAATRNGIPDAEDALLRKESKPEDVSQTTSVSGRDEPGNSELSLVELYIPGDAREIEGTVRELRQAFNGTGVEVRPVRRILYSEGKVLKTIRGLVLWLTGVILVIIALCVTATMTAIVLERRKDVALMKALGASNRQVMLLFLAEGGALGLLAGVGGYVAGALLASELGWQLFGVSLRWAWWVGPLVCLATVLLAVLATFLPVRSIRAVNPAVVLKGA